MKKQFSFLMAFVCSFVAVQAQVIIPDTAKANFEWVVPLLDMPFAADAAQAEANRRAGAIASEPAKVKAEDFAPFYRNLSMVQNTEMARNLHGTFYYGSNVLWNSLIKRETTKGYILNRALANLTSLGVDFLLIKFPYGFAYQHEEFHRSVMAVRGIYSYDEVWTFGKGFDIAVTQVKDDDLIYLKNKYPADLVRLHAAGVEGEYAFFQRIQEDNFFDQAAHPAVGLMILGTIHGVSYVNLPFADRFNAITDSILSYDKTNELSRDFTGYDFSAWVYDLHRPQEAYHERGPWPEGTGIKRPIKESDLTPEMRDFLKKAGNMQYLNFISPFLVGINRLRMNDNLYYNFAFRSILSSFGYYSGADVFVEINKHKLLFSGGINKSNNLTLPDLALKYHDWQLGKNNKWATDLKLGLWLQPKDQMFYSQKSAPGALVEIQPNYRLTKSLSLYSDLSYKTPGWVFGNPYLDSKFMCRLGAKIKAG